jgi:SAM-dependent methyltransferase
MKDGSLFPEVDSFKGALERFGQFPVTVWEIDVGDAGSQSIKKMIGDTVGNTTRAECFTKKREGPNILYAGKVTESIFNPQVCSVILNMFAPEPTDEERPIVFDPFAGGGTRAILTSKKGLQYWGVELRNEECEAVRQRAKGCGADDVEIQQGDSKDLSSIASGTADFLITCPPYFNMEQYGGGANDLSTHNDYPAFLRDMSRVIAECFRILKKGALACWVVGLHRFDDKRLIPLHHDIARLHLRVGFEMREEIILHMKNTGAILRVGNFFRGNNLLIRTHEYCLVFRKP